MSEHQGWDLNVVVVVYTIHYKTIFNILIEWPLQWNDHCIDVNTNLADFTGVVVSSFCCFSNTTNVWDCAPVQRRYNYPRRWHDIKILIACLLIKRSPACLIHVQPVWQDGMIIFHYLAIYNNENLPHCLQNLPK